MVLPPKHPHPSHPRLPVSLAFARAGKPSLALSPSACPASCTSRLPANLTLVASWFKMNGVGVHSQGVAVVRQQSGPVRIVRLPATIV